MSEFEVIDADVLVVGGGFTGCRAAIEAINQGVKTVLITKGRIAHSGCSVCSLYVTAVGPWSYPEDSIQLYMEESVKGGEYMADQELAKILFDEVGERYMELEKYGGYFKKNEEDGTLEIVRRAGHSIPRTFSMDAPYTGKNTMKVLKSELLRLNADIMEEVILTNLLTHDGTVVGATGLDYLNGSFKIFRAKSTILATGHCDQIFRHSTVGRECTGEGIGMAYRVGAELIDMENHLILGAKIVTHPHIYMIHFDGPLYSKTCVMKGLGKPRYLNINKQEYLTRFRPPVPMAPKTLALAAHEKEIREDRVTPGGGVFIDWSGIPNLEDVLEDSRAKIVYEKAGIDLRKDLLEAIPASHANTGGIRVNALCETSVPGLYAAGACAGPYYGWQRIPGFGVGQGLVFGKRAGEHASIRAKETETPKIDQSQVGKERDHVINYLENAGKEGVSPLTVKNMIRTNNTKHFIPCKNEAGLKEALKEIERIRREELPRMVLSSSSGRFNYEWVEALEVPYMLLISEIKMKAALIRKETRGPFIRMDYPKMDDEEWLKHIIVKQENGEMRFTTEPVKLLYFKKG